MNTEFIKSLIQSTYTIDTVRCCDMVKIHIVPLDNDTHYIHTRYKRIRRIYVYYKRKPVIRIDVVENRV